MKNKTLNKFFRFFFLYIHLKNPFIIIFSDNMDLFFLPNMFSNILKVDEVERSFSMAFISMLFIAMIYLGVILILAVIETVGKWQVYKKMGIPPWKCLIPYYNNYVEYKTVWRKEFFFLLRGWLKLFSADIIPPIKYPSD